MASSNAQTKSFLWILAVTFACFQVAISGDADILSDFVAPQNTAIDGNFFTYTGLRAPVRANADILSTDKVSQAALVYPAGTLNPPHTHPRSSELPLVLVGSLEVGFVNTTNELFTQTLQAGDMSVFPRGIVHYQYNTDLKNTAVAVSAFGSASAGNLSIPTTLFTSGIDDGILAKAFRTDVATIISIKKGLLPIVA